MDDTKRSIAEIQEATSASSLSSKQQKQQKGASASDNLLPLEKTVDDNNPTDMAPTDFPLPTADQIATALHSLPGVFFHRIASRIIEVGIDGKQLMGLIHSIQPPAESATTHLHELNYTETVSDKEVKESSSSKREIEQHLEDERENNAREISRTVAGAIVNHVNPSKKQKLQTSRDISISPAAHESCNLPTPEEIAAVLELGPGKYFEQLASRILEMGIDGKQLRKFVFSVVPHVPVNVVLRQMLPLLDRVLWNRVCSMNKEIHDASRGVVPPWPYKRLQTGSIARSLVFSPDGGLLACACNNGIIRIWDRSDGRCTQLEGHTGYISSLSFSLDGKTLASGGSDRSIRLWRLADNSCRILEGHTEFVMSVAFEPNGQTLASGSFDGSIRIWDITDGTCTKVLRDERMHLVCSVAFSPDGATLASGGYLVEEAQDEEDAEFGIILLWDLLDEENTGGALLFQSQEINSTILSISYSPDGRYLAAGSSDSKVRLWNVADCTLRTVFKGHNDWIRSVRFSPNGKILASAGDDCSIRLWNVGARFVTGRCLVHLSERHSVGVLSVAFSPCGRTLASGGYDGDVQLWNPFEESERDKNVDWERIYRLWNYRS
jgi:WD40 repeat protein